MQPFTSPGPTRLLAVGVTALAFLGPWSAAVASTTAPTTARAATDDPTARPALSSPITVAVTPAHPALVLSDAHDYVVQLPAGATPLSSGVTITGGHNVVIDGGTITVPKAPASEAPDQDDRRGLYLKNQTGTAWIHGVHLAGPLSEGIDLSEPGAATVVVLSDIAIDEVSGYTTSHHPDLLQTWAGPSKLYVDGLTGSSTYQGFFLVPSQHSKGPAPALFSLKNVSIDVAEGAYGLWRASGASFPIEVDGVTVDVGSRAVNRDQVLWPRPSSGDTTWNAVKIVKAPTSVRSVPRGTDHAAIVAGGRLVRSTG